MQNAYILRRKTLMISPLFIKFRSAKKFPYIYDALSGEIVRVSEEMFLVADDYHVLPYGQIKKKYTKDYGEKSIDLALKNFDALQKRSIFLDHKPIIPENTDYIQQDGVLSEFGEYLESECDRLVLNITNRCNLKCEYCTGRTSTPCSNEENASNLTMSFETACRAISDFMARCSKSPAISIYGGEPLLEFDLVREIIRFSESHAKELGIDIKFGLVTNGTLLSKEVARYLVEHNVRVIVSLDGPEELHNRYRVFPHENCHEKRGSFDTVMHNVNSFIETYPNYRNRGFNAVLAFPLNLKAVNDFFKPLSLFFPQIRIFPVKQRIPHIMESIGFPLYRRIGHCDKGCSMPTDGCLDSCCNQSSWSQTDDDLKEYSAFYDDFIDLVMRKGYEFASREIPIFADSVLTNLVMVHLRPMYGSQQPLLHVPCPVGRIQIYCNTDGAYYPCEKIDVLPNNESFFSLGNAQTGFASQKSIAILNTFTLMSDCGNCVARRMCTICPSYIKHLHDSSLNGDEFLFQCGMMRQSAKKIIAVYTSIMEQYPHFFDSMDPEIMLNIRRKGFTAIKKSSLP